jgi:hypothetical protein
LVFTGCCIASTFGPAAWYLNAPGNRIISVLGLFVLAWGFGYAYLRRTQRFLFALCSGLVLSLFAWWLNIVLLDGCIDLSKTQQCPQRVRIFDRPFAVVTAATIGIWVLLYAYDAFLLAGAADIDRSAEDAESSRILRGIAITSTVIGIVVLVFYLSPYCNQLWENTR